MRHLPLLLLAFLVGCPAAPDAPSSVESGATEHRAIPPDATFAPDRVIVGFRAESAPARIDQDGLRADRLRVLPTADAALYSTGGLDVREAVAVLVRSGRFAFVEPDYRREATANDPYLSYQWHLAAVNAEDAWLLSDGTGALVAVLDTGATSGPYDGLPTLVPGYDFVNGDSDAADDNGHGTHVSGTVAQATDNAAGVAGLAPGAQVMPIKVLDHQGYGYTSDIILGIEHAVAGGAHVINMSLGSTFPSFAEESAVWDAYLAGVFLAAAAGNAAASAVDYPAGYDGVVAVGATDYSDGLAYYSNGGDALDLVAPGGDVYADLNGDGYADGVLQETFDPGWGYYFWDGTSMSTPHVAATAALLMSLGASHDEALQAMVDTAVDLEDPGWDAASGYGLIDAASAVQAYLEGSEPVDADGDGFTDDVDCDDGDDTVYPGAPEVCDDGIDQDCDGADEACPPVDSDGDGYTDDVDCDDGDDTVYPGAPEVCDDGIDQDCDGADEACATCSVTVKRAQYKQSKSKLVVVATCDDISANLAVYADGIYVGDMTYKKGIRFKLVKKPVTQPSVVEVVSDCGGSDSKSVTVK